MRVSVQSSPVKSHDDQLVPPAAIRALLVASNCVLETLTRSRLGSGRVLTCSQTSVLTWAVASAKERTITKFKNAIMFGYFTRLHCDLCYQAIAQVCAFSSPKLRSVSAMAILRHAARVYCSRPALRQR